MCETEKEKIKSGIQTWLVQSLQKLLEANVDKTELLKIQDSFYSEVYPYFELDKPELKVKVYSWFVKTFDILLKLEQPLDLTLEDILDDFLYDVGEVLVLPIKISFEPEGEVDITSENYDEYIELDDDTLDDMESLGIDTSPIWEFFDQL
jgi:hypothetical protein